jgi:hypothetical protein
MTFSLILLFDLYIIFFFIVFKEEKKFEVYHLTLKQECQSSVISVDRVKNLNHFFVFLVRRRKYEFNEGGTLLPFYKRRYE